MSCVEQEATDDHRLIVNEKGNAQVKEAAVKLSEQRLNKERRCKSQLISRISDNMLEYI